METAALTESLAAVRDRLLLAIAAIQRDDLDTVVGELESTVSQLRAAVEELRAA